MRDRMIHILYNISTDRFSTVETIHYPFYEI